LVPVFNTITSVAAGDVVKKIFTPPEKFCSGVAVAKVNGFKDK